MQSNEDPAEPKKKTLTLSEQSQTLRNEITRKANPEKQSRFVVNTGCGEGGDGR